MQDFSHLKKLPCRRIEYYKTIWHLYRIALNAVTVDYKQVMQNASLCAHYRVPTKNVSKKEMRYWIRYLNNTFLSYRGLDIGIKYFLFIAINSGFWIEKGKYII